MRGETLVANRGGCCFLVNSETLKRTTPIVKLDRMRFNGIVDAVMSMSDYFRNLNPTIESEEGGET